MSKFKILFYILYGTTVFYVAQTNTPDAKHSLKFLQKPLREVLNEISTRWDVNFIYSDDLAAGVVVSCSIENLSLNSAVSKIVEGKNIAFKVFDNKYYVLFKSKNVKDNKRIAKPIVIQNDYTEVNTEADIERPILISKTKILYPPEAIRNNIEGKVSIRFLINKNGDVTSVLVNKSSGSDILDSATVKYSRNLKFYPAFSNGKSINVWMIMTFDFFCIEKENK